MGRKKVLYIHALHPDGMDSLRNDFDVAVLGTDDRERLLAAMADADAVVTRLTRIDAGLIDAAPRLKAVAKHGVGVDNIDVVRATERGIAVLTTGDANSLSVAEHTVLAIGALAKQIVVMDREMRQGNWAARDRRRLIDLRGKRLGIVGMGKIGSQVARIAHHGFGMEIMGCDPYAAPGEWKLTESLDELCAWSDVLSLHLPLSAEAVDLIDARRLGLMRKGSFLVNYARGGIVNEDALCHALKNGPLAAAAVDAFADEPIPGDHPILGLDNVILSPHCASFSEDSRIRMSMQVAEGIRDVLEGRTPKFAANGRELYRR